MKILFLTYYFEPDLCAGSFRSTAILNALKEKITENDQVDVVTIYPNRYNSFKIDAPITEKRGENITIHRIKTPDHNNDFFGQMMSFKTYYKEVFKITRNTKDYDLVYASSSRLFTAFLGARLSRKKNAKLYLDIRDIFRDTMLDIFSNVFIKIGLNLIITPIEKYTFKSANHINLVSKGFSEYFEKYNNCSYSYFTNGIDKVFLEYKKIEKPPQNEKKTILYAGNIGEGQGLHIILPKLAQQLDEKYNFVIIGDGGTKRKLVERIEELNLTNIKILPPMERDMLIIEYQKTDYLFLHLNKYKAFEKVLPSKIFEYACFNKPIIAGVSGYAAEFIKENLNNYILFDPGDSNNLIKKIESYTYKVEERKEFKKKFSRTRINNKIVESFFEILH